MKAVQWIVEVCGWKNS